MYACLLWTSKVSEFFKVECQLRKLWIFGNLMKIIKQGLFFFIFFLFLNSVVYYRVMRLQSMKKKKKELGLVVYGKTTD